MNSSSPNNYSNYPPPGYQSAYPPPENQSAYPPSAPNAVYPPVGQAYSSYPMQPANAYYPVAPGTQIRNSQCFSTPFRSFLVLSIFTIIELIIYIISASSAIWFQYCFWNFALDKVEENIDTPSGHLDHTYTLSHFYDLWCEPDTTGIDVICPHFCKSVESLKTSKSYILAFGAISIFFVGLTFLLLVIKNRKPNSKIISKKLVYLTNILPLVFYIIGFASYYAASKFSSNFDNPTYSNPDSFTWGFGMVLSIIQMIIMAINAIMTKCYANAIFQPAYS